MIVDAQGLCARLSRAPGVIVDVPYRIPAHGMCLFGLGHKVEVTVTPICAIEDPPLMRWLAGSGVYRVEDLSGRARIGQGTIIDRVRRHRAYPTVTPIRLVAMTGYEAAWGFAERCYLEERLARHWVGLGNGLSSTTFNRGYGGLTEDRRLSLDGQLGEALELVRLAERILDMDADHLAPIPPDERVSIPSPADVLVLRAKASVEATGTETIPWVERTRHTDIFYRFRDGTDLYYADGHILAHATARSGAIELNSGSTVHMCPTPSAGTRFVRTHAEFLALAAVSATRNGVGTTTSVVRARSAAFLMKLISGARSHNARRWRVK